MRLDACRGDIAVREGVIDAIDVMRTELCSQRAVRTRCPRNILRIG